MCGVAGYTGGREIPEARVTRCLELMRRRGPDAAGCHHHVLGARHTYLLHTRLSIIDLDPRAHQPFRCGNQVLAYNGELYNYLELKKELAAKGEEFRTTSDTEVLARLLAREGWTALAQCEGMWAFAFYSEADGSLLLSRDRFGEKPLYLFRDETGLYFGSEVKFIVALLGRPLAIDYGHLYRYLVNGYRALYATTDGFFLGLRELPAGQVMQIGAAGSETASRYWEFSLDQDEDMTFTDAVAGVRERLIQAVRLRLRSDVPLAFCLSGGIDSNSLTAIAKKGLGYDVHGFTIVNTDARYEEQDMVACSVSGLGIRHTAIPVQPGDFLTQLRELVRYHDAPVYTISYYAHWLLMQAVAAHGYRVSISGTGADELFSGYYDHHLFYLAEIAGDRALFDESLVHWTTHIKPIVRNPFLQDPYVFVRQPDFRGHLSLDAESFSACLSRPWSEAFSEQAFPCGLLRRRMLNELFREAVPVILHEDDLNAMYFSIENRSPFLDAALFQFSLRIPTRHLIRHGAAKAVLREAMRGLVPDPILDNRRKVGFNVPVFDFLDRHHPAVRQWVLADGPVFDHVRRDRVAAFLDRDSLPNSESKFLFNFLNCKLFLEEFAS